MKNRLIQPWNRGWSDFARPLAIAGMFLVCAVNAARPAGEPPPRPNILFALADDWGWPHAGIYGEKGVQTPVFDRIARQGVLFNHAFVTAPSCTPSRNTMLTGQYHWRLEEGVSLFGTLAAKFAVYPDILRSAGYHVGYSGKGWGPGDVTAGGRTTSPGGRKYAGFEQFLREKPPGAPFCFWFAPDDPHRPYPFNPVDGSIWITPGLSPAKIKAWERELPEWKKYWRGPVSLDAIRVPAVLPDCTEIREDLASYYYEVGRFDAQVGACLGMLENRGELADTLVVITGDNGIPFSRHKCTLYDGGTRVPLAIAWGRRIPGGRVVEDFVNLMDLAPTFLEAAGLKPPGQMTGRSLVGLLTSPQSGWIDPRRDRVFTGLERHSANPGAQGYPMRAIRTRKFLYIRNFMPGRPLPEDGMSSSKTYILAHKDEPAIRRFWQLGFGPRPEEELYDIEKDPAQVNNVAQDPAYREAGKELRAALMKELLDTGDPRALGRGDVLDAHPVYGHKYL